MSGPELAFAYGEARRGAGRARRPWHLPVAERPGGLAGNCAGWLHGWAHWTPVVATTAGGLPSSFGPI